MHVSLHANKYYVLCLRERSNLLTLYAFNTIDKSSKDLFCNARFQFSGFFHNFFKDGVLRERTKSRMKLSERYLKLQ